MTHDPLTVVAQIRPEPEALNERWSSETLASIMGTPSVSPPRRTRRAVSVVAAAVGVGLLGTAAAAAAGIGPQVFTDAFGDWGVVSDQSEPGTQAVDPAAARRVATAPGPGRTSFTLVAAQGAGGFECVAALFETTASTTKSTPTGFVDANGSQCAGPPPTDAAFGDMAAVDVQRQPAALGSPEVMVFSVSAGRTDHAVVRTSAGDRPLLRYGGRFYGWAATNRDTAPSPVLIGYTASDDESARSTL